MRGLPAFPDVGESREGLPVYALLAPLALGVPAFGPDNAFVAQDFPHP